MTAFYTFKRMERSLRTAFGISPEQASKFQARIKNLQNMGFTKGDHGEYTEDQVHRWFVALALAFIPKPSKVAVAVTEQWDTVRKIVERAASKPDVVLYLECNGLPRDRPAIVFHAEPLWKNGAGFVAVPLSERVQAFRAALEARGPA